MSTLEELKNEWERKKQSPSSELIYSEESFGRVIKSRVRKNTNASMKYFWASFTLQLLAYALLSHVIVKYWDNRTIVFVGLTGMLAYIPFLVMLMKRFKAIAVTKPKDSTVSSLRSYVNRRHELLQSFYRFKRRYELFLIPLVSAIGVWLVFQLWVPGGVYAYPSEAVITFGITLISCVAAIWSENKKSFEEPLRQLRQVLDEFKNEE